MDTLDMIRVFQVVARTESFTKAAYELDMAVQTVSKYIKALEDRMQVKLFNRTTRQVSLNDTGRAYLARSGELLDQFDELENDVMSSHAEPRGKIRLSAPTAFGELHLMPALARFQQRYAKIELDIDLSNRRVSIIDEGFDVALRIGTLPDSTLIARKLIDMRLVVCATPDYLEKHGMPDTPGDLANHNCFIDHNYRHGHHWPFVIDGKLSRVDVAGSMQANSPQAIRQMVLHNLGIGMCPMYVISQDVLSGRIECLLEPYEAIKMGVYAVYPHRQHLSQRMRALLEFLSTQFRQLQ